MTTDEIKAALDSVKSGALHPTDAAVALANVLEWVIFEASEPAATTPDDQAEPQAEGVD
jgi:hypothetical protein